MWEYYCRLRGATDVATINQLVVADKLFATLDPETAVHIGVRQGEGWFKPRELAKECDTFFVAKGKSYSVSGKTGMTKEGNLSEWRNRERERRPQTDARNSGCFNCGSKFHFIRNCPQMDSRGNKGEEGKAANVNVAIATEERESDEVSNGEETMNEDEALIARVGLVENSISLPELCRLQEVEVRVQGRRSKALVDSGSQITVLREGLVPGISIRGKRSIYLKGVFGPPVKCRLAKVRLALMARDKGKVGSREVVCAIAKSLTEEVLLPPGVLKLLREDTEKMGSGTLKGTDPGVEKGDVSKGLHGDLGTVERDNYGRGGEVTGGGSRRRKTRKGHGSLLEGTRGKASGPQRRNFNGQVEGKCVSNSGGVKDRDGLPYESEGSWPQFRQRE